MAEVIRHNDSKDDRLEERPDSTLPFPKRCDGYVKRERKDDRDFDRPPNRRGGVSYVRDRSPPLPPLRARDRDYKQ
ncbi:hypothetical protein Nepgr_014060 [Nepenthes gracilis]|uniref:Uncharacterized protein n=1 Tax=Nepenthes gracilis TaxID=150966 RepID=A0AAD3SK33_NEPGR|nr:hypothetical protein Nepgr_014060 [Nepenthes gracilis]